LGAAGPAARCRHHTHIAPAAATSASASQNATGLAHQASLSASRRLTPWNVNRVVYSAALTEHTLKTTHHRRSARNRPANRAGKSMANTASGATTKGVTAKSGAAIAGTPSGA